MEILIYVLVFVIIIIAMYFVLLRYSKINNALINLKKELIVSENISFFLKEISVIPFCKLQKLSDKEKEEIIEYLTYMIKNYLQLSHLLSEMEYYKLKPGAKQFVIDHLKKAWTNQSAAVIYTEIICNEALSYPHKNNSERERNFIMYNYKDSPEFQVAVIENLQSTKNSPLLKSLEVEWIDQEIKKLQKQFTQKN